MIPRMISPDFYVMTNPHQLHIKSMYNFLMRNGLHESYVVSHKSFPPEVLHIYIYTHIHIYNKLRLSGLNLPERSNGEVQYPRSSNGVSICPALPCPALLLLAQGLRPQPLRATKEELQEHIAMALTINKPALIFIQGCRTLVRERKQLWQLDAFRPICCLPLFDKTHRTFCPVLGETKKI